MAPKKESIKKSSVIEAAPPPPQPEKPPPEPKYGDKWFDDPIEGEEAIRMSMTLQQRIEEKAAPVRTWLEQNIVGLLLQALSALVAFRPSNPHEFLAAHLIKNNPLKDTFPEDDPKPRKPLEEEVEPDDEYDPCGCDRFKKKEPPPPEEPKEANAGQLAKKSTIAAEAAKASVAPDAARASVLAKAKAGSATK
ncbi:hypothetical protein M758_12G161700 [Ceratodon purpureus]|nr:hypothetical protein M758_12G161700 [Ceratodon purpureus]